MDSVQACLPILSNVVEIVANNRPHDVIGSRGVAVGDQPVGISDHGGGSKSGTVTLRST